MSGFIKKYLQVFILILGFTLTVNLAAYADPGIDITGQVRLRSEFDKRSFSTGAAKMKYSSLRTRVALSTEIEENTKILVQFQDSRMLGDRTFFGQNASGTTNDGKNVDVHQAYIKVKQLWDGGPGIKAGRFEVNFGNQRVFGAVGWSNVGRSWEGFMAFMKKPDRTCKAFYLKRLEVNSTSYNRDFDIFGLYLDFKKINLHAFGFYEYDADKNFGASITDINALDRFNIGMYYKWLKEKIDFEMNFVYQFGEQTVYGPIAPIDIDIAAFLFTFEAGLTLEGDNNARLAFGVDYSSGDGDGGDDKFKAYQNSYYTGHKFRGYMDYFVSSSYYDSDLGLMDIVFRGKIDPTDGWKFKGDLHYFKTAQEYNYSGEDTKDVGFEIDLTLSTTRIAGVVCDFGASIFMPSDSFARTSDSDPGYWLYSMMTAGF
jgi:hypothetical protein